MSFKFVPGMLLLLMLASTGADGATMMMRNRKLGPSVGNQRDSGMAFCDGKAKELQQTIRQLASIGCLLDVCARGSAGSSDTVSDPPCFPAPSPCECPAAEESSLLLIIASVGLARFFLSTAALLAIIAYFLLQKK